MDHSSPKTYIHLFQVILSYSYLEEEDPVKTKKVKEERQRNSKEVLNIVTETATETARRSFHECHCCGWGQIIWGWKSKTTWERGNQEGAILQKSQWKRKNCHWKITKKKKLPLKNYQTEKNANEKLPNIKNRQWKITKKSQ